MSERLARTEILKTLFDGYKQNPNSLFDIEPICVIHGLKAPEVAQQLKELKLIKADIVHKAPRGIYCAITITGICRVDFIYVEELMFDILEELNNHNGSGNVTEYLNTSRFHFQFALDLAYFLQKLGYLTIELIDANLNSIVCDLSEQGKDELDRKQAEAQMKRFQKQQNQ